MSGEKEKRKSKKKSKHRKDDFYEDYVEIEVARAMKEMEKAMKQAKIAEKEARKARKDGSSVNSAFKVMSDESDTSKPGTMIIHSTVTHPGSYIHVESAENVQVGSHNTMHVYKDRKNHRKSSKADLSSDSDGDFSPLPKTTDSAQMKQRSNLTESEKRVYNALNSEREVTHEDITVCCEHVGNWRRFLRHLGLDDSLLEQIHQDFHTEGVRQIIYHGVIEWTRREGSTATLGALAKTLRKVGYGSALNHLQP